MVDDGSKDGTGDAVRAMFPQVQVIQGDGNLFWGGGMRAAFAEAMKGQFDFYLWLNDDIILDPHAVGRLLQAHEELIQKGYVPSIILGSVKDPRTGDQTYGGYNKGPWFAPLSVKTVRATDRLQKADTMNGNCVLIDRECAKRVGNVDPSFPHLFGDIDYGLRALKQKCSIWILPGYIGDCESNNFGETNKLRIFSNRWDFYIRSKKGFQYFGAWKTIVHRHGGPLWIFQWLYSFRHIPFAIRKKQ